MEAIYQQLKKEARRIVSKLPAPRFQQTFAKELAYSKSILASDPLLVKLKQTISPLLDNDFGHGMLHSDLVCVDAGAIVQIEMNQQEAPKNSRFRARIKQSIRIVQLAGLLHDIKRKEKNHSEAGALFAKPFLTQGNYNLTPHEIKLICNAIREHEAFKKPALKVGRSSLISNALYDADKFRWGPDNFTHTIWDMVIFSNIPVAEFIKNYPDGMIKLSQIKHTFRTTTGKIYGPNFIDQGIDTGDQLFTIIEEAYGDHYK